MASSSPVATSNARHQDLRLNPRLNARLNPRLNRPTAEEIDALIENDPE
jgi:hypothetical protein